MRIHAIDALLFDPKDLPTVADVLAGKEVGPYVCIHAWRGHRWLSTERVLASEVKWHRLLPEDHVETVS